MRTLLADSRTPASSFCVSCRGSGSGLMRARVRHTGTNVNARNAKGQTALSVACAHGSPGMAQLLLAHPGIDKRATDNGTHDTAHTTPHRTHDTTRTTRTEAFGWTSADGVSVLMLVAATGRDQFLDVLLQDPEIRATINDADKHGDTALHHAFQSSVFPSWHPTPRRTRDQLTHRTRTRTHPTAHARPHTRNRTRAANVEERHHPVVALLNVAVEERQERGALVGQTLIAFVFGEVGVDAGQKTVDGLGRVVGHLRPLLDGELLALDMRFERSLLNNMAHTCESAASCTHTPHSHHRTHTPDICGRRARAADRAGS